MPHRIVSLLPSATEIVAEIGLGDRLVGVTHECDFPAFVKRLPKVTRTLIPTDATSHEIDALVRERRRTERALYTLDRETLASLRPDLIVTQALCDVCAVAEAEVLSAADSLPGRPRVVNLEPTRLDEVFDSLLRVGDAAGVPAEAERAVARLRERALRVASRSRSIEPPARVVLLEWISPPFSCGHWTPELIRLAGGIELLGKEGERSRTLGWNEVVEANPDAIAIACCGFDIERTLRDLPILKSFPGFGDLACAKNHRVYVIDGSAYFSRPGPRLVESLEILAHVLHPNTHPALGEGIAWRHG